MIAILYVAVKKINSTNFVPGYFVKLEIPLCGRSVVAKMYIIQATFLNTVNQRDNKLFIEIPFVSFPVVDLHLSIATYSIYDLFYQYPQFTHVQIKRNILNFSCLSSILKVTET